MITIEIKSSDMRSFFNDIDKYSNTAKGRIIKAIDITANNIKNKSQGYAPRATSRLAGGYHVIQISTYTKQVYSNIIYDPYVEFGTGISVAKYKFFSKIEGLREFALQFKGKGKRKIDRKPTAHLYKAVYMEQKKYIDRLNKAIDGN